MATAVVEDQVSVPSFCLSSLILLVLSTLSRMLNPAMGTFVGSMPLRTGTPLSSNVTWMGSGKVINGTVSVDVFSMALVFSTKRGFLVPADGAALRCFVNGLTEVWILLIRNGPFWLAPSLLDQLASIGTERLGWACHCPMMYLNPPAYSQKGNRGMFAI